MKFKKDDMGLYIALTLVGGGVGIMAAALISSRTTRVIERKPGTRAVPVEKMIKEPTESEKEEYNLHRKNYVLEDLPVLAEKAASNAAWIEKYKPNQVQLQMLEKGLISKKDVERLLGGDKPDLEELVVLPEEMGLVADILDNEGFVIDDRYVISDRPPEEKSSKNRRVIYYDQEDNTVYTFTRTKDPVSIDVRTVVSLDTWATIQQVLDRGQHKRLYVDDLQTVKYYRFELLVADEEDPATNNSDSDK